jgi:ribosomal protein L23
MTKTDIKQYLEKIYKIDVLDVTTLIKQGSNNMNFYMYLFVFV